MCYTPSDYAWMDVPNPYLQPETGIYQAPHNTTYKRDYFGPDKVGNSRAMPEKGHLDFGGDRFTTTFSSTLSTSNT